MLKATKSAAVLLFPCISTGRPISSNFTKVLGCWASESGAGGRRGIGRTRIGNHPMAVRRKGDQVVDVHGPAHGDAVLRIVVNSNLLPLQCTRALQRRRKELTPGTNGTRDSTAATATSALTKFLLPTLSTVLGRLGGGGGGGPEGRDTGATAGRGAAAATDPGSGAAGRPRRNALDRRTGWNDGRGPCGNLSRRKGSRGGPAGRFWAAPGEGGRLGLSHWGRSLNILDSCCGPRWLRCSSLLSLLLLLFGRRLRRG